MPDRHPIEGLAPVARGGRVVGSEEGRDLVAKARELLAKGRSEEAAAVALRAAAGSADARTLGAAGWVLSAAGRHDDALAVFERAAALAPGSADHQFNLAMEQRFVGRLAEAERSCDRAIALRPGDAEAWLIRSGLRRQTAQANHLDALRARLSSGPDWRQEAKLRYALGKELEDLERYSEAFGEIAAGARLRRSHMRYDVGIDEAKIEAVRATFAGPPQRRARVGAGPTPIFVIGLPRTGTTLVQRILSAHPQVAPGGELTAFTEAVTALTAEAPRPATAAAFIASTRELDPDQLGELYLARAAPAADGKRFFIDKMPLNYLYCGLIQAALPQAPIVALRRHPLDSCLAMFKTHFQDGYPFSYDLDELGRYYLAFDGLMSHWRRELPGQLLEVAYEDLVADLEPTVRRILDHCGLAWDEACLRFHENRAASTTASAAQIRRPIYADSVGAWRHYERELSGLRDVLAGPGWTFHPEPGGASKNEGRSGRPNNHNISEDQDA